MYHLHGINNIILFKIQIKWSFCGKQISAFLYIENFVAIIITIVIII